MIMKYVVIKEFKDLQDNERIYEVGEEYQGKRTKARITELSTDANRLGVPLIQKEEETKQE